MANVNAPYCREGGRKWLALFGGCGSSGQKIEKHLAIFRAPIGAFPAAWQLVVVWVVGVVVVVGVGEKEVICCWNVMRKVCVLLNFPKNPIYLLHQTIFEKHTLVSYRFHDACLWLSPGTGWCDVGRPQFPANSNPSPPRHHYQMWLKKDSSSSFSSSGISSSAVIFFFSSE